MEDSLKWYPAGRNDWCSVANDPAQFHFRVNTRATKLYTNFLEAVDDTSKLVYQDWGDKPLYLSLSGGMDSELMAKSLLRCNIPFIPLILKAGKSNQSEVWYAEYFCKMNNLNPVIINMAPEDLYTRLFKPYLHELGDTHFWYFVVHLFFADYVESLGGYYFHGYGDINYYFEVKKFYCRLLDYSLDVYRPGKHPTGFFMYTPEIVLSYMHQFDMSIPEQYNKINFYDVMPRPKIDYFNELMRENPKVFTALKARSNHIPVAKHHWFGTKEETIALLSPK